MRLTEKQLERVQSRFGRAYLYGPANEHKFMLALNGRIADEFGETIDLHYVHSQIVDKNRNNPFGVRFQVTGRNQNVDVTGKHIVARQESPLCLDIEFFDIYSVGNLMYWDNGVKLPDEYHRHVWFGNASNIALDSKVVAHIDNAREADYSFIHITAVLTACGLHHVCTLQIPAVGIYSGTEWWQEAAVHLARNLKEIFADAFPYERYGQLNFSIQEQCFDVFMLENIFTSDALTERQYVIKRNSFLRPFPFVEICPSARVTRRNLLIESDRHYYEKSMRKHDRLIAEEKRRAAMSGDGRYLELDD